MTLSSMNSMHTMLKPLITAEQIAARVEEIGAMIRADFPRDEPIVLVAVLKGSCLFVADLCRQIEGEVLLEFMQLRSYGDARTSSGQVQIVKDLDRNIEGMNIVIVEDIVDSGLTLNYLLDQLRIRKPKVLKVATLLVKPEAIQHEVQTDYVGFTIPPHFVVGYGLDDAGKFRNLPYVAQVDVPADSKS